MVRRAVRGRGRGDLRGHAWKRRGAGPAQYVPAGAGRAERPRRSSLRDARPVAVLGPEDGVAAPLAALGSVAGLDPVRVEPAGRKTAQGRSTISNS